MGKQETVTEDRRFNKGGWALPTAELLGVVRDNLQAEQIRIWLGDYQ